MGPSPSHNIQRLLTDEVVYDGVVDVPPVVAAQQHLPLAVQEVDSTAGHRQAVCNSKIRRNV